MRSKLFIPLLTVAAGAAACAGPPVALEPEVSPTSPEITADDLRHHIGILAHDSLRGRDTGSPEIEIAADYLADVVRRLGLRPAGERGTFFQSVPLERRRTSANIAWNSPTGSRPLGSDEVLPISGIAGLPEASHLRGAGQLIFAGHIMDPEVTEELTLEQLSGAVVMVRMGPAPGADPATTQPRPVMGLLFSPASPASAVFLIAEETEQDLWNYVSETSTKGSIGLRTAAASGPTAPPFFLLTTEAAEDILGTSLSAARTPRTGLGEIEYAVTEDAQAIEGRNVIAVVPGSDPTRANEYVTLGAHYDHVGVGTPVDGDSIYNGADDNASGTGALLEVAERLATLPPDQRPARSVLFAWVTAEEAGLLGSEYFTDNPTVPRESMVAHINIDMGGRNHPDSIFSVGTRRIASELGDIVEAVNRSLDHPFIFDYEYDRPGHPEQIYCRSDHYNYARYGIPILFLTTGLHDQYHQPGDEVHLLDFDKLARVSELVYEVTMELGNRPARPVVDQPVPPLGTPCIG